jgi:hypothetical protein
VSPAPVPGPATPSPEPGDVPESVHDLFDGRLGPAEADAERRRVASDPALKEAHDDLVRVREFVRAHVPAGAKVEPPPGFGDRLRARLRTEGAAATRLRRGWPRTLALAYAAAALTVVGATVAWVMRGEPVERGLATSRESVLRPATPAESARLRAAAADAPAPAAATPRSGGFQAPGGSVRPGIRDARETPSFVLAVKDAADAPGELRALLDRLGPGARVEAEVKEAVGKAKGEARSGPLGLVATHVLLLDADARARLAGLAGASAQAPPARVRLLVVVEPPGSVR